MITQFTPSATGNAAMNVAGETRQEISVPKGTYLLNLSYNGSGTCHVIHRPRGAGWKVLARVEAPTSGDGGLVPRSTIRPVFVTVVNATEQFRVDAQNATNDDIANASASLMLTPMEPDIETFIL